MIITNQALIKCFINDIDIKITSNKYKITLLNPIIKFFKCNCLGNIIIELINDSGTIIDHVFYKDLLDDKSLYIKGSLKVNGLYNKSNPIAGLYLGSLKANQKIKLKYKVSSSVNPFKRSLLYYCYFQNGKLNHIYTLNNTWII